MGGRSSVTSVLHDAAAGPPRTADHGCRIGRQRDGREPHLYWAMAVLANGLGRYDEGAAAAHGAASNPFEPWWRCGQGPNSSKLSPARATGHVPSWHLRVAG